MKTENHDFNVISKKNLPTGLPWKGSAVVYLLMEHFNAPGWLIGTFLFFGAVWFLACLLVRAFEKQVNVFEFQEENFFINRVRAMMKK